MTKIITIKPEGKECTTLEIDYISCGNGEYSARFCESESMERIVNLWDGGYFSRVHFCNRIVYGDSSSILALARADDAQ